MKYVIAYICLNKHHSMYKIQFMKKIKSEYPNKFNWTWVDFDNKILLNGTVHKNLKIFSYYESFAFSYHDMKDYIIFKGKSNKDIMKQINNFKLLKDII